MQWELWTDFFRITWWSGTTLISNVLWDEAEQIIINANRKWHAGRYVIFKMFQDILNWQRGPYLLLSAMPSFCFSRDSRNCGNASWNERCLKISLYNGRSSSYLAVDANCLTKLALLRSIKGSGEYQKLPEKISLLSAIPDIWLEKRWKKRKLFLPGCKIYDHLLVSGFLDHSNNQPAHHVREVMGVSSSMSVTFLSQQDAVLIQIFFLLGFKNLILNNYLKKFSNRLVARDLFLDCKHWWSETHMVEFVTSAIPM